MNASVFGNKIGKDMSQPVENKCLDFDLQEKKAKKINLRRPGIEPEPRDWETRMLTITPTTLRSSIGKNGCIYVKRLKNEYYDIYVPVGIFTE